MQLNLIPRPKTVHMGAGFAGSVITRTIEKQGAQIYDFEMERTERQGDKLPSAIMTLRLSRKNASHSAILSSLAELSCVDSVQELIS